jgi:hypothetical protein
LEVRSATLDLSAHYTGTIILLLFFQLSLMQTHESRVLTFMLCTDATRKSEQLLFDSRSYERQAKWLNTTLFWRKWAPVVIVGVIILCCIYLRLYWFY